MAPQASISLWVLLSLFAALLGTSKAYKFYVGGRDGWVLRPSENYNHWAERMRFQVNDTLFFKYKNGENSVLIVNQGDYDNCNKQSPIGKLDGGDSVFMFDRSGPFFFISGYNDNCQNGQKLIVVVMAVRNKYSPPTPPIPAAAPSPTVHAPPPSPSVPAAPSPSPSIPAAPSPSSAPKINGPDMAPVPPSSSRPIVPPPTDDDVINPTSRAPPPPPPLSPATAVTPSKSVVLVLFLLGGVKFGRF